jgi:beta-phosphoglucomutase-like phosphatase (HAD superfamily)
MPIAGAIFDVDGVLVDSPHERAWREAVDGLMAGAWRSLAPASRWSPSALTSTAYQQHVAGRPRLDGAAAVLALFGIADPDGGRARTYADVKQARVLELIGEGDFRPYDDALRFLLALVARGVRTAAASSSRNAPELLRRIQIGAFATRAGLENLARPGTTVADALDADLSGERVEHGKPDPAIFLRAAHALDLPPAACVVVEDATAGIRAARAGGFRSIGVARHGDDGLLRDAGADHVVQDLEEIDVEALVGPR